MVNSQLLWRCRKTVWRCRKNSLRFDSTLGRFVKKLIW